MKKEIRFTKKGYPEADKIRKRFGWEGTIMNVNRESTVVIQEKDVKVFQETVKRGFLEIKR